jgi:hypothetical protein
VHIRRLRYLPYRAGPTGAVVNSGVRRGCRYGSDMQMTGSDAHNLSLPTPASQGRLHYAFSWWHWEVGHLGSQSHKYCHQCSATIAWLIYTLLPSRQLPPRSIGTLTCQTDVLLPVIFSPPVPLTPL